MPTGTIKKKLDGFGFIAVPGEKDVFFHHSSCNGQFDNLQEGQSVQFDVEKGDKGPKAANVVAAGQGKSVQPEHQSDVDGQEVHNAMAA